MTAIYSPLNPLNSSGPGGLGKSMYHGQFALRGKSLTSTQGRRSGNSAASTWWRPGTWFSAEKFATIGNGLCFLVFSLIFSFSFSPLFRHPPQMCTLSTVPMFVQSPRSCSWIRGCRLTTVSQKHFTFKRSLLVIHLLYSLFSFTLLQYGGHINLRVE